MERTRLSQLLRIISREHTKEMDLNTRIYDSGNFKKYYRSRERNRAKQEDYKNQEYMRHKNLNKRGYKWEIK